jgi:8-oxo-dGTP diphosphatase
MTVCFRSCPTCGHRVELYLNPAPTADVIVHDSRRGVVLIRRGAEPFGWALPGGFIDYGESAECAAVREALKETGLRVRLEGLLGVYSHPDRDPRAHSLTVVYPAAADNPDELRGGDDAVGARFCALDALPPLVFDHARILDDFRRVLAGGGRLAGIAYPLGADPRQGSVRA